MLKIGYSHILIGALLVEVILFFRALGSQVNLSADERRNEKEQNFSQLKEAVKFDPTDIELRLKLARLHYPSHRAVSVL